METDELIKSLRTNKLAPIYLLHGEEPFFIDVISDYMHDHILNDTEKVFNLRVFYGKETDHKMIIDEASQYPMMSDKRMIILKEAQDMRTFSQLEAYFEKPVDSTILVICHKYKKVDARLRATKLIKQHGVIFESKKLYDNQLPAWIQSEATTKNIKLKPEAIQLISEYLGTDLGSISKNLDKIKTSFPDEDIVTAEDLESIIGIHKEYNVFELQKALGQRDTKKVFQIINYFDSNPKSNPMVMIMASLYSYFSKIYAAKAGGEYKNDKELMEALQLKSVFFLKDYKESLRLYSVSQLEHIMLLLREYDLKSKGVNSKVADEGELLKELVSRMMM